MSRVTTRLRSRAHPQREEAGRVASSMPCWRRVGVMARRSWLCAANHPPYLTWCTRGGGTRAVSFSTHSNGDSLMPLVPSDQAQLPMFGSTSLMDITREDIKRLIYHQREATTLTPSSIRQILAPLRGMLNHAVEDGMIASNPAARVGRFLQQRKAPGA